MSVLRDSGGGPQGGARSGGIIRIFLLDDHEVVRRGIAELLADVDGFEVVGEAGTASEALPRALACRPDVAILDMRLPDGSGVDVCRDIRSQLPDTYCLILTSYDDEDAILASVLAGASGYMLKEVRTAGLVDAIRQVAIGRTLVDPSVISQVMAKVQQATQTDPRLAALTEREREVLDLIADGLTNRQIGERMFLTEKTVKNYASSLFAKLGVERRSQAAVFGAELRHHEGSPATSGHGEIAERVAVHDEYRTAGVLGEGRADRPQEQTGKAAMTAATEDDHDGSPRSLNETRRGCPGRR